MESNWRYNPVLVGVEPPGANFPSFTNGPIQYVGVLNPPIVFGGGTATHLAVYHRATGGRHVNFFRLLATLPVFIQGTVIGNTQKWWLTYPVLPD